MLTIERSCPEYLEKSNDTRVPSSSLNGERCLTHHKVKAGSSDIANVMAK
jgi:hypothetical protein